MRRLIVLVILILLLSPFRPVCADTYEEAATAYQAGDYATALIYFRRLALEGHAPAQVKLGSMYLRGLGVRRDPVIGAAWLEKAAAQDDPAAQFDLGLMSLNGEGVAKDDVTAFQRFRQAAAAGFAPAQLNLGVMYATGLGVMHDDALAFDWCRKAAEQGYAPAQLNLGVMYEKGQGVLQDAVQAHAWYSLAAQGLNSTSKYRDQAVRSRDRLAARMTTAQKSAAREAANSLKTAIEGRAVAPAR